MTETSKRQLARERLRYRIGVPPEVIMIPTAEWMAAQSKAISDMIIYGTSSIEVTEHSFSFKRRPSFADFSKGHG